MGNCQAAEAATVIIHHPGSKIERIYWSVSANEIMNSNPGHYVALVVTSPTSKSENGSPLKQLKILRPDDTLLIGRIYRLISFEDVLKEFAAKKCMKLGRLLKESGGLEVETKKKESSNRHPNPHSNSENGSCVKEVRQQESNIGRSSNSSSRGGEGIVEMVDVGNGSQPYRALQRLEFEKHIHYDYSLPCQYNSYSADR